jgi:uncharacterized protein YkwD
MGALSFAFGAPARGDDDLSRLTAECLAAHNAARRRERLEPLRVDKRLTKAAQAHADWMAKTDTIHHIGEDESKWFERAAAAGYDCDIETCSENVAEGPEEFMDGKTACDCWLESRVGHKDNVLSKQWRHVGFGMAIAKNGRRYWAALYARPKSTTILQKPTISASHPEIRFVP